jgi:ribosomal protein S18 acetylase RimI-like enzyme
MDKNNTIIRLVETIDLHSAALQKFNRYQVTNRVMYKENDQYLYKNEHFIECWDEQKRGQVIQSLQRCISMGGITAGAFRNGELIGFASVENEFFGKKGEYLELSYIHISYEYRNCGIGKKLFSFCCEKAKTKGARKLYIAAHPAEETQHFYKAIGCVPAAEVSKQIYDKEPLDIQLELAL